MVLKKVKLWDIYGSCGFRDYCSLFSCYYSTMVLRVLKGATGKASYLSLGLLKASKMALMKVAQ